MARKLGGGSPLGGKTANGKTPPELIQQDLELLSVGRGNVGSMDRGSGGLYWETSEYGGAIYCHQVYPGPLPGGGEMPRGKYGKAVVVTTVDVDIWSMGGWGGIVGVGIVGAKRNTHQEKR